MEIMTRQGLVGISPLMAEAVDLGEIGHALAMQCRWNGHLDRHYSVAEHSVRVMDLLRIWGHTAEVQLAGLLHDAAEAILGDIPRPAMQRLGGQCMDRIRQVEGDLLAAIFERAGLKRDQRAAVWSEVFRADDTMLRIEDWRFFRGKAGEASKQRDAARFLWEMDQAKKIKCWPAKKAEQRFASCLELLMREVRGEPGEATAD